MADVENVTNGVTKGEKMEADETVQACKRKLEVKDETQNVESTETPSKKVKIDESVDTSPMNDLEKKIVRQIDYYFGDINFPRDKFMNEKKDQEGWIPLSVMLTFKRLETLTTDTEIIIKALKKSDTQFIQVSEDHQKIRRAPEFPLPESNEEHRKQLLLRTAYVKGFPIAATLDELLTWFDGKNTENVTKRVFLDKSTKKFSFKGSVFAVFKTVEDCKAFIEGGPYHYDTDKSELIVKWQEKYIEEKRQERQNAKAENAKLKKDCAPGDKKGKGGFDNFDWCIAHLKGLNVETVRDDIKAQFLEKYSTEVKFVEHEKGEDEAFIRLGSSEAGTKLIEQLEGDEKKVEVNGTPVVVRLLEGEELEKHVEKTKEGMANSKGYNKRLGKRSGKKGKHGHGKKHHHKGRN